MRKGIRSFVSLVIVAALLASFGVNRALADEVVSRIARPVGITDRIELAGNRSRFKREYLNPNGTVTAEFSSVPVCYRDEAGAWMPLDPSLVVSRETAGGFDNDGMSFSTRLRPMNEGKDGYLTVTRGNHAVSFSLEGAQSVRPSKGDSFVDYEGALPGVTIRCLLQDDALKEDIILREPPLAPVAVRYTLKLVGLTAQAEKDASLTFRDERTGGPVFLMAPLFMTDAAGHRSTDVALSWDGAMLIVTPDLRFLTDPSTVYPVTIDPSITLSTGASSLACASVRTSGMNMTFPGLYVGSGAPPTGITSYGLIQADLNALPPKIDITSAILSLTCTGYEGGYPGNDPWISGHRITSPWSPETVTWNTQPAQSPDTLFSRNPTQPYPNDITTVVNDWLLNPGTNHGIALAFSAQTAVTYRYTASILVTYAQRLGSEDYWAVQKLRDSQPYGAAVNAANGNLILRMQDLDWSAYGLANPVVRTYNSLSLQDGPFGFGWTSSLSARMSSSTAEARIMQDEDGTFHEFTWQGSGPFRCPEIPDYMEEYGSTLSGTLKNKKTQTARVFGDDGRLLSYQDWCQNSYMYVYDVSGKLASVTDPAGRSLTFTYNADGRVILMQDWSLRQWSFVYDGEGNLILSTDVMGRTTSFQWAPGHLLTSITDPRGDVFLVTSDPASGRLLSCVDAADATTYTVQVSSSSAFDALVMNQTTMGASIAVPSLAQNTPYYWRVGATNGPVTSPWSSFGMLVTPAVSQPPPIPALVSPADTTTVSTLTPTLTWAASSGATSYTVQVCIFSNFWKMLNVNTSTTETSLTTGTLSSVPTYYWRVNAVNASGTSSWSSVWSFTVSDGGGGGMNIGRTLSLMSRAMPTIPAPRTLTIMSQPPSVPVLTYPYSGSTISTQTPTLSWYGSSGTAFFTVQVSTGSGFGTSVIINRNTTATSLTTPVLDNARTYYWRVSAATDGGTSAWSSANSFTTPSQPPLVPTLSTPTYASTISTSTATPTLMWNTVHGASSYIVQVSTGSTFTTTVANQTVWSGSSFTTPTLAPATAYYWRVKAGNSAADSTWSSVWHFTTPSVPSVPTLAGCTPYVPTLTATWNPAQGATSYNVQTSTQSGYWPSSPDDAPGTSFTFNATSGVTYYWRVQAVNAFGTSAWSSAWSVTAATAPLQPPAPPVLGSPSSGATVATMTPTLSWNLPLGAIASWTVQVSASSGFETTLVNQSVTSTSFTTPSLGSIPICYWRVRATNAAGTSPWSFVWSFRTPAAPPTTPILFSPAYGAITATMAPTLHWNAVTGASSYNIQISRDSGFGTGIIMSQSVTGTSFAGPILGNSTTYYWHVRAVSSSGTSSWSPVWNFLTPSAAGAPMMVSPEDGSMVTSLTPGFMWTAYPGASSYTFQLSASPTFTSYLVSSNTTSTSWTSTPTLTLATTYYWRVRATMPGGVTVWYNTWTFHTRGSLPLQLPVTPVLLSPANGTTVGSLTPTLTWRGCCGGTSMTYDFATATTFVTDARGGQTAVTMNAWGNPVTIVDPVGATSTFTWIGPNRLDRATDPRGGYTTVTWIDWNVMQVQDPAGITTQYTYNAFDQPTHIDQAGAVTIYTYTPDDARVATMTDAAGRRYSFTYTPRGLMTTEYQNDQLWRNYTYDAAGNCISTTDAQGNPTTRVFNERGWCVSEQTTLVSSSQGSPAVFRTTSWTYDAAGEALTQTAADGSITTFTYDANGNRVSQRDHLNNCTTWTYDLQNRLLTETDPTGAVTHHAYDVQGNQTMTTLPGGQSRTMQYDLAGRLVQVVSPNGSATSYGYDTCGNLTSVQSGAFGKAFTYDIANRPSLVYENGALIAQYTYDAHGDTTQVVDARGIPLASSYNGLHELTGTTSPTGANTALTYDQDGNVTEVSSSSSGLQTFTYDTLRRLVSFTDATGYQVQYAYDAGSRLTSETTPSGTASFAWDLLDRATQVIDPLNHVTSYTYDAVGRRLAMLSPNALSTQYTYDASSRITELKLVNSTTQAQLLDTLATYDANGNVLVSGPDTYTYDATQQLASWTRSGVQTSYTYDGRGNLTSIAGPSGTTTFTVDPATNRLLSVTVPGQYTDTWTYDAAGNPLTRSRSQNGTTQLSTYAWDATGKLSSVIRQGQTTLTFAYAPDGTLTRKEQGTQVTTYAYDVAGVSRESTTSSAPITYQHGGAGELVSMTMNNQTYYYHFNAHGDTIALSDGTGTLIAQYAYDPWGTLVTNTNPSLPNPYLYCGAWGVRWNSDLGLYLMGARWYNPSTGRFLTKDSYPPDLLAPITQNPYQYCGNNPVKNIDPQGHEAITATMGLCAVFSGGTIGGAVAIGLGIVGGIACVVAIGSLIRDGMRRAVDRNKAKGDLRSLKERVEDFFTKGPPSGHHGDEIGALAGSLLKRLGDSTDGMWKAFFVRIGETTTSLKLLWDELAQWRMTEQAGGIALEKVEELMKKLADAMKLMSKP